MHYKQTFSQKTINVRAKILAPLKSGDVLPLKKYKTKTNVVVVDRKQNFI